MRKICAVLGRYLFGLGIIFLCAFLSCMGIQMIEQDAGVYQMETFSVQKETFRALKLERVSDEKIEKIADTWGISFEKLLAAEMLSSRFQPSEEIFTSCLISHVLEYERLDEEKFSEIASYYKKMFASVEFLPLPDVLEAQSDKVLYHAAEQMEGATCVSESKETEDASYLLQIPLEEDWQQIVPVVCMKTGTVVSINAEKMNLCLESEDGIRIIYGNLKLDLKEWSEGDTIEGGELLGTAAGDELQLQFWIQDADGSWFDFNGLACLFHGEKKIRKVEWR